MRLLCLAMALSLRAQQSATVARLPDLNGGFTGEGQTFAAAKSASGASRTEYAPGVNGSLVARETVQEKVIRDDADGRVVERYARRHDQNGNPGPVEKTVIEERKSGGGAVTVNTTVYRGDLNGNLREAERSVSRTVTRGAVTSTDTTVERAGMDGQFAPVERVSATTVQQSKTQRTKTVSLLRRDASGNFYEAVKETSNREEAADGQVVENRAQYVGGALAEQAVTRIVKDAGGAVSTTVDVYSTQAPGQSADIGGKLFLKEQHQVTRQPEAGGQVTETVVTRKPSVADANRLGPAQVVSKSVCSGACAQP